MAGNPLGSSTFTTEFGHEIEAERERWLRRRFLWYAGAVLILNILGTLGSIVQVAWPDKGMGGSLEGTFGIVSGVFTLALYGAAFWYVKGHSRPKVRPLRIVYWLIVITGVVQLLSGPILAREVFTNSGVRVTESGLVFETPTADTPETPTAGDPAAPPDATTAKTARKTDPTPRERALATVIAGGLGTFSLLGLHFFACLFLPWTPGESLKPLVPLLILNGVLIVAFMGHATITGAGGVRLAMFGVLFIALSGLVAAPGAAICWWRYSRFRDRLSARVVRGKYLELRQELTNARTIHESLFPRPCLTGPVRFNYVYEPMRQIGGDYLYATFQPGPSGAGPKTLSVILIDVTGHGIPAALTVNRLHGELERIFAENPTIGPGDVLRLLNSYVHLTLATHSVYVTALCFRVDPHGGAGLGNAGPGSLEYASGGHPPAFLRGVDGRIEQLDSTTFVLGACAGVDFRPHEKALAFHPGDTLIAYTDGALEARNASGRFLGIAGIQKILTTVKPTLSIGWPSSILKAVEQYRHGPTEDDTLVIEITRPLESGIFTNPKSAIAGAAETAAR